MHRSGIAVSYSNSIFSFFEAPPYGSPVLNHYAVLPIVITENMCWMNGQVSKYPILFSINSIGILCNLWLACLHLTHTHVHSPICETFSGWWGFPGGSCAKEPTCQCRRFKRRRFDPWFRKIPWRRAWQPTLVFLPGESHGQRSLVGYSPWGCKESDPTEVT